MGKVKKVLLWIVGSFIALMVLSVVVATLVPSPNKTEPPKKVVEVQKPKPQKKVVKKVQKQKPKAVKKVEKPKPKPKQEVDLVATVRFDQKQFTIINRNNFDWTQVKMEVNSGLIASGYILEQNRLKANTTYTVGALQFAKPDGTRLNPFTTKVLNMTIRAKLPNGQWGWWYGGWE